MVVCGGGEGVNAVEIFWLAGGSVLMSKLVEELNSFPPMANGIELAHPTS